MPGKLNPNLDPHKLLNATDNSAIPIQKGPQHQRGNFDKIVAENF